jgi:hypothetical protein
MASKVEIFNQVAIALGDSEITDVDQDSQCAIALRARYDAIFETALTTHRWGFARQQKQLSKLEAVPLMEWTAAFQIPAEALAIIKLYPNSRYLIYGETILSDQTALKAEIIQKPSEGLLPAYFENALVLELAAQVAVAVTGDASISNYNRAEATRSWIVARAIESQQRSTEPVADQPFIYSRRA